MTRALLLNATYEPLHFTSDTRAIILLLKGRAEVVSVDGGMLSMWDEYFTSPGPVPGSDLKKVQVPATIRLLKRVHKKWKAPKFQKRVLFNRDKWCCQYCNVQLRWETITIDHVLPSSRGGLTTWKNCASACKPCNKKKANMTPEEAGMRLLKVPADPSVLHFWDSTNKENWHPHWQIFLNFD